MSDQRDHKAVLAVAHGDVKAEVLEAIASTLRSKCAWMNDGFIEAIAIEAATKAYEQLVVKNKELRPDESTSRLLGLPPEIRNIIYEMVVRTNDGHTGHLQLREYKTWDVGGITWRKMDLQPATKRPGLLGVNRQIRNEALPLFYAINSFAVTFSLWEPERLRAEWRGLQQWLLSIGRDQASMIKHFNIRFWFHDLDAVRHHIHGWLLTSKRLELTNADDVIKALDLSAPVLQRKAVRLEYDDYSRGNTWYELQTQEEKSPAVL